MTAPVGDADGQAVELRPARWPARSSRARAGARGQPARGEHEPLRERQASSSTGDSPRSWGTTTWSSPRAAGRLRR